jgi:hypothetical protein
MRLPLHEHKGQTRRRRIRQHTSAYVSIRQHTSAYVSIRQHTSAVANKHELQKGSEASRAACSHASAYVGACWHTHTTHELQKGSEASRAACTKLRRMLSSACCLEQSIRMRMRMLPRAGFVLVLTEGPPFFCFFFRCRTCSTEGPFYFSHIRRPPFSFDVDGPEPPPFFFLCRLVRILGE